MHYVSPKAFGHLKTVTYEEGAQQQDKPHYTNCAPQGPSLSLVSGDNAADTPSQSNFDIDNYIVSVQNTRQMCQSTRKHFAEQQMAAT